MGAADSQVPCHSVTDSSAELMYFTNFHPWLKDSRDLDEFWAIKTSLILIVIIINNIDMTEDLFIDRLL